MRPLTTRGDLLSALPGDWLLAQLVGLWDDTKPAYALGGAVVMYHQFGDDPEPVVVGDPEDALTLTRTFGIDKPLSVPEATGKRLVAEDGLAEHVGWAFRWTTEPSRLAITGEPEWAADEAEVKDVLTEGFPDASLPVGHRTVRRWAGLRRDRRLVAVAADATVADGLGFLASIATRPDVRGTGAGLAVTAWATDELVREHGACGLWHMSDNAVADAIYTRLGYADEHRMAVVGPPR